MDFELTETPGKEWDEFVSRHTDVLFYYSIWGEVLKQGLGGRLLYSYIRDRGEIMGGMPGVLLNISGIRLFYSSLPYGGYLGEKKWFEWFFGKFKQEISSADVIHITPYCSGMDMEYLKLLQSHETSVARLNIQDKIPETFETNHIPSLKQSINKGNRMGLTVRRCEDEESITAAYELYQQTMRRNRAIPKYPKKWFEAIYRILIVKNLASLYMVDINGLPVSATAVIHSESGAHLLHNGSSTKHLSLRANDIIVCEIVKDEMKKGKHYIDLMHSEVNDIGMIGWKEKFGSRTIRMNNFYQVNSSIKYALWMGMKQLYPIISPIYRSIR